MPNTSLTPRHTLSRARGFTLIELAVALVGGLIVGIAVVGLSKEATNTFHEDMRAAQAQFSVRTAIDRLRGDVSRAGFMATPNIWGDPQLVTPDYVTASMPTAPLNIQRMAGIRLFVGGSVKKANITGGYPVPGTAGTDDASPFSANNNLSPDAIDISGNMNTVEVYNVQTVGPGLGCAGGTRLYLAVENPPAYRLLNGPGNDGGPTAALDTLKRAFIPVAGERFALRLQDAQGRVQYLETCDVGITPGTPPQVYVDVTGTIQILNTGTGAGSGKKTAGGESGFFSGSQINPVLTVRYKISPPHPAYVDLNPGGGDAGVDSRFDLYRYYINTAGAEVGTPDLIAEYAVDLKFGLSVDNTASAAPNPPPLDRTQISYPFDDGANNAKYGGPTNNAVNALGPQRIRSVRIRLATRTAVADRQSLVSPAFTPPDYANLLRYCTTPTVCGGYARVRTVITEVNLNNIARGTYP
jgi:type II secretory pathway pseudopilin PulG